MLRNCSRIEKRDQFHYQKIVVALIETSRIMKEIDEIKIESLELETKKDGN